MGSRLSIKGSIGMQGLSVVGIILFWAAGFALPCLSLPLRNGNRRGGNVNTSRTILEGVGGQTNPSLVTEEALQEKETETKLEEVEVVEDIRNQLSIEGVEDVHSQLLVEDGKDVRNQRAGFHNDSHGTLISKGW